MARSVFMGEYNLEEAKHSYDSQQVVRYVKTWLHSYSRGESTGEAESSGSGGGSSIAEDDSGRIVETLSSSLGAGRSRSSGSSYSEGAHESLAPVLERRSTQGYSLEEQIYRSMAIMVNQATQRAIVKLPGERSRRVKTPDVGEAHPRTERTEAFKDQAFHLSDFALPARVAADAIEDRRQRLLAAAKEPPPSEPQSFS